MFADAANGAWLSGKRVECSRRVDIGQHVAICRYQRVGFAQVEMPGTAFAGKRLQRGECFLGECRRRPFRPVVITREHGSPKPGKITKMTGLDQRHVCKGNHQAFALRCCSGDTGRFAPSTPLGDPTALLGDMVASEPAADVPIPERPSALEHLGPHPSGRSGMAEEKEAEMGVEVTARAGRMTTQRGWVRACGRTSRHHKRRCWRGWPNSRGSMMIPWRAAG